MYHDHRQTLYATPVPRLGGPTEPPKTARAAPAHLLDVAAARRLRALKRRIERRSEDADYWKAVAPAALAKARSLRQAPDFAALP
jgi:hypothetical protein